MNILLVLIPIAVLLGLFLLLKSRVAPLYSVPVSQLPSVVAKLHGLPTGRHGTWAVFMFSPPGARADEDAVNLQYSVEGGTVGLDWVLISKRNVADKEKLKTFMSAKGFTVRELEMNGVRYLRTAGSGIDRLGVEIITGFYGIPGRHPGAIPH